MCLVAAWVLSCPPQGVPLTLMAPPRLITSRAYGDFHFLPAPGLHRLGASNEKNIKAWGVWWRSRYCEQFTLSMLHQSKCCPEGGRFRRLVSCCRTSYGVPQVLVTASSVSAARSLVDKTVSIH